MQTRRVLELTVGLGLLLGPLVYALSLDGAEPSICPAEEPAEPEPVAAAEPLDDRCETEPSEAPEPVVEPAPAPAAPAGAAEFLFVTDAGIILSDAAERGWATGRSFEPAGEVSYRAAKRVDTAALPTELWQLAGREYDLYGPEGKLCTARLGELRVVAQYDGWGVAGLLGDEWYDQDPDEAKPAAIRKALWEREDLWLVAAIAADGPCEGALWARDAALPPPTILRQRPQSSAVTRARLAAFAESEELAETKRVYQEAYAQLAAEDPESLEYYDDWATIEREHGAEVWAWVDPQGQARVVGLEFGQPQEACGDFMSSWITALDYVRGDGFEPVEQPHRPRAIFDADGDGQLELLYRDEDGRRLVSPSLAAEISVDYDWYCPC